MPSYTGPKKPSKPAPKRKKAMPAKKKGGKTKMLTSSRRGN